MAHEVIIVPGIGDHRPFAQDIAAKAWRGLGLRAHYLPLGWGTEEGYEAKHTRLLNMIDRLHEKGGSVSLVGISAGASAVINARAATDKVHKVVCISGKINHPERIGQHYFDKNPDFEESMARVAGSLVSLNESERTKIMSIHPWHDNVVPIEDTVIPGAKELTLPGWGHVSGIFFALTLGAVPIARFIRKN